MAADGTAGQTTDAPADRIDDGRRKVAIACQGGGSHTAFTAGFLVELLGDEEFWDHHRLVGLSGTSGGAVCASLAWSGLHSAADSQSIFASDDPAAREEAARRVQGFWADLADPWHPDQILNRWALIMARFPVVSDFVPGAVSGYTLEKMKALIGRYFDPLLNFPDDLLPRLHVGAVDICEGRRHVFHDEEVDVEAIIASAAVPPLYRPVLKEKDGAQTWFWDGLFATNPPLSELVRGSKDLGYRDKPDILLLLQINPTRKPTPPTLFRDQVDRRNELAGNIALSHELGAIDAINAILQETHRSAVEVEVDCRDGTTEKRVFSRVEVKVVELDDAVIRHGRGRNITLDLASKYSIEPGFINGLITVGREQARQTSGELIPGYRQSEGEARSGSSGRR